MNGKTPYELLFKRAQRYDNFLNFGCLCYACVISRDKDKFGGRSRRCVFVGYPHGQRGWRVCDLDIMEYFVPRDVVFSEHEFPYVVSDESPGEVRISSPEVVVDDVAEEVGDVEPVVDMGSSSDAADEPVLAVSPSDADRVIYESPEMAQLGRGHRCPVRSIRLANYVTYSARCATNPTHVTSTTNLKSSCMVMYPLTNMCRVLILQQNIVPSWQR